MKLRVYVSPPEAEPGFTEIDSPAVREVSGTGGVFAAHPEIEQDEEGRLQPGEEGKSPWRVTHLPSGLGLPCPLPTRGEAEYLARQVFAATPPGVWSLTDPKAIVAALPRGVVQWTKLIERASVCGVPILLLKSCGEFLRTLEENKAK